MVGKSNKNFNGFSHSGFIQDEIRTLNLENRIDIANRKLLITGEIEEFVLEDIITKTDIIQCYSKKSDIESPITWQINSFGGDVYEMFAILDYIRLSPVLINTHVHGKAMSAAAMILVAGNGVRSATKYSSIMFHESSGFNYGKISDQEAGLLHTKGLEDWVCKLLEERTAKDAIWWKSRQKIDMFLTPTSAMELGVIDKIV